MHVHMSIVLQEGDISVCILYEQADSVGCSTK